MLRLHGTYGMVTVSTPSHRTSWWYYNSILDDGAKLAIRFCTKNGERAHQPLEPLIGIDLDLPD